MTILPSLARSFIIGQWKKTSLMTHCQNTKYKLSVSLKYGIRKFCCLSVLFLFSIQMMIDKQNIWKWTELTQRENPQNSGPQCITSIWGLLSLLFLSFEDQSNQNIVAEWKAIESMILLVAQHFLQIYLIRAIKGNQQISSIMPLGSAPHC